MTDRFAWKWRSGSLRGVWSNGNGRLLSALNICVRCSDLMVVSDAQAALAAGADDFDTKPVRFEQLLGKIDALLKGVVR